MRVVETKVYSFDELSEQAKKKVVETFANSKHYADWIFEEAGASLDAFCKLFDIDDRNIDFLEPYRNQYTINTGGRSFDGGYTEQVKKLSGARLMSYLWNNYGNDLYKPKYVKSLKETVNFAPHKRVKVKTFKNGNVSHTYYSAIFKSNDCPLTGVCYDYSILQPIFNVMEGKDLKTDFEDLISECITELCRDVEKEYDYLISEQAIAEHCEANEYEFTEDGKRI
jgi:hypothetical protein